MRKELLQSISEIIGNYRLGEFSQPLDSNMTINGNVDLRLKGVYADGDASMLNGLTVNDICDSISKADRRMTPEEYEHFQKVLQQRKGPKQRFMQALYQHILSFSEGVAARVGAAKLL